jgi:hypothetical protein
LEINGTYHLLVYTGDVNVLEQNINAIMKNTETVWEVSREVGLEVNTERTEYMVVSRHPSVEQNRNLLWKYRNVQVFENNRNKSVFHLQRY